MKLKHEYWVIYRAAFKHVPLLNAEIVAIQEIYVSEGRDNIYEAVQEKKIVPAAAALFCRLGYDVDFWGAIVEQYRIRNQKVLRCLDNFYSIMSLNGITRIAVVENFGALLASGQSITMFGSGDVDNYADISEKDKIYSAAAQNGYEIREVWAGEILISSSIHSESLLPEGFYLGINWDVTCRTNLPCYTARGSIIDWKECHFYQDTQIRLPPAESLMYICMMHIAVHGFCKPPDIRLYYDIANADVCNENWDIIANWAVRDKNCIKVSATAYLASHLLGVHIPDAILALGQVNQIERLLRLVYCDTDNRLLDFPSRVRCVLIDANSDDDGFVRGFLRILLPDANWLRRRYGGLARGVVLHLLGR